jgi:hypothetical protein
MKVQAKRLRQIIKEEVEGQRVNPSAELTNQLLAEINDGLEKLPERVYFFISESKKSPQRRMHRLDLQILNEKLADLNAFIGTMDKK